MDYKPPTFKMNTGLLCNVKEHEHKRSSELYCLICNHPVCASCLKFHSEHSTKIVDIEDEYEESISSSNNLSDSLKHFMVVKNKQKNEVKNHFDIAVGEKYEEEVKKIDKLFRSLHSQMHEKEVELKKHLQDNYQGNTQIYEESIQKVNDDIKETEIIINDLEKQQSLKELKSAIDKETKLKILSQHNNNKFMSDLNAFKDLSISNREDKESRYSKVYFKIPMMTIEDVNTSYEVKNNDKIFRIVYIYGNQGFQRLNLTSKKLETIDVVGDKFQTTHGIFKSMIATNENIFLFKRSSYLKYDPLTKKWRIGTFHDNYNGGDWQSIEYDGKDYIYLFGGCIESTNHRDINRFNIRTEALDVEFHQTRIPIRFQTTCIAGEHIYTVGGVKQSNTDKEAILERFDTKSKELKIIRNLQEDGYVDITAMVYVKSLNSIFMLNREHAFFKYDIINNSITQLQQVVQNVNQFYNRLTYDQDNTIYCISKDAIYEYNIQYNIWSKLNVPRFQNFDLYVFGICYTNKF